MGSLVLGDVTEDRRRLNWVCSADAIGQRFALGCFLMLQHLPLPLGTSCSRGVGSALGAAELVSGLVERCEAASKRGESPAPAFLAALPWAFSKSVISGIFLRQAPSNGHCIYTRSKDPGGFPA